MTMSKAQRGTVRKAARALAGAGRVAGLLVVAAAAGAPAAAQECAHPQGNVTLEPWGDLTGTGTVNVSDAICGVLAVQWTLLGEGHPPECLAGPAVTADTNCDGVVDISDVVAIITRVLVGSPPVAIDPAGDGCPLACTPCVPPDESSCLIGGDCVGELVPSAAEPCLVCEPDLDAAGWTALADGAACGGGKICQDAVCVATLPGAPGAVSGQAGDGAITVSFSPPTSDGGSPITGYVAEAGEGGPSAFGATSPITIGGLTNGASYVVRVAAINGVGQGPFTSAASATTPFTVPSAPSGVTATEASSTSITVSFSAPFDGGSPITGYTATCSSSTHGSSGAQGGPSSPLVVGDLTAGQSYTCTVTATNAAGTSAASNPSASVALSSGGPEGPNLLNGIFTGGTAQVVQVAAYGGANVYSGDLTAACGTSWRPQGTLCDEAPTTGSPDVSTKSNNNSGLTWNNGGGGTGVAVIDLGGVATFQELRTWQMFSDGKVTSIRFAIHPTTGTCPDWPDAEGWSEITGFDPVPAGSLSGNQATGPAVHSVGTQTTRCLRVEARNSGVFGSSSYIEIRAIKMFAAP